MADLTIPRVTEASMKSALRQWGKRNLWCCQDDSAIEQLKFLDYSVSSATVYEISTFVETRTKGKDLQEPIVGGSAPESQPGSSTATWDLCCAPKAMFRDEKATLKLPIVRVQRCTDCRGKGMSKCKKCKGKGRHKCKKCRGKGEIRCKTKCKNGKREKEGSLWAPGQCKKCSGTGKMDCPKKCFNGQANCKACKTRGHTVCKTCKGGANVRVVPTVKVAYKTHTDCHVDRAAGVPTHMLQKARGDVTLDRTSPQLATEGSSIGHAASQLLGKHAQLATRDTRILMQNHTLTVVPVHKITAQHPDGRLWTFWLLGSDYLVYNPNFPEGCKCACTIM